MRAGPKENRTNGFFIAVFIRKSIDGGSAISLQIPDSVHTCIWESKNGKNPKDEKNPKRRCPKKFKRTVPVTTC